MKIAEIWRYPVKSMAGERLHQATLTESGIPGDRLYQVRSSDGRIVDARAHPRLLGLRPSYGADGTLRIDGRRWDSSAVARDVETAGGPGTKLVCHDGMDRFDVLPLLVATDSAIAAFGYDGRRLRPNLVVGEVHGLAERGWEGKLLRVGVVSIGVHSLRGRCVMTTYDPDTQEHDPGVFQRIVREFGGVLALNCSVVRGGTVRLGDPVVLEDGSQDVPQRLWGRYASGATRCR